MSKKGIVADFDKIMNEVEVMKQGDFNELRYFLEIRKLYALLQAIFAGGGMVVNSEVMNKVPIETLEKQFNILIQMVCQVSEMAFELRELSKPEAPSKEKKPPMILHQEKVISYLV